MLDAKKILTGAFCMMFLLTAPVLAEGAGSETKAASNPYIAQYFLEKENQPKPSDLVESIVEDQIAIDALTDYYLKDVKVAQILSSYDKDARMLEKATSLKKEDKTEVMHKIQKVYKQVRDKQDQQEVAEFLERYARSINDEKAIAFLEEIQAQVPQDITMEAVYDGYTAGTWAYNNYNKYDPAFPAFIGNLGSDCTNFVSQAMWHGGKAMAGNWYIYKKNSTYLYPDNITELNYSWTLSDPSPWISVEQFNSYWRPKSAIHPYSHTRYITDHANAYRSSIFKGDVVVFHKGISEFVVWPTHVMIISGYDATNQDFLLAGHSTNRQAYPLLSLITSYPYIEFLEIP